MFRKIVSNLSFSPALVGQLSFYAKRLKKEETTRRLGLIFVALALVVQSLSVFSPPEAANAANSNDLVYGGIRPADGGIAIFLANYDQNTNGLRDIMNYFGITRGEIAASQHGAYTDSGMIRRQHSVNHRQQGSAGEQAVTTTNTSTGSSMTFFTRPWFRADNQPTTLWGFKGYSAELQAKTGVGTFYLMDLCGNLLIEVVPPPPVPKCEVPGKTTLNRDDPNCFVNCTFPGKTNLPANDPQCFEECKLINKQNLPVNDPACEVTPCPYEGLSGVSSFSKICVPPVPAELELSKSAKNMSQGNVNATSVTAKAGDQITYTITAENSGGTAVTTTLQDDLTDILEYAKLTDNGGGTFDEAKKVLSWGDVTLEPGDDQVRTFSVRLLSEIPTTAQGISDNTSYDCRMLNVFGNQTIIRVDCQPPKVIEQTVAQLPKTGPTENMLFAGVVLAVVAYFYLRSRQLGKEVRLVRRDLNTGAI